MPFLPKVLPHVHVVDVRKDVRRGTASKVARDGFTGRVMVGIVPLNAAVAVRYVISPETAG